MGAVMLAHKRKPTRFGGFFYVFLLCLLSVQAWGAIYFIHGDTGDDLNDGSSALAPKRTYGSITVSAGDYFYIKGGTTLEEQLSITADSITITNWPTDTAGAQNFATGDASYDTSGKWIIDCENTRQFGIYGRAISSLTMMDGEIKNCTENAVHVTADTAATTESNIAHVRLIAHDIGPGIASPSGETQYHIGTCFFARTAYPTVTGTAVLDGVTYTDTVAYNCGKHGYDTRWRVLNVRHVRALAYNSGLTATGHGFSIHPLFETFSSSGWTNPSSTIYCRDRSSNSNQERRVVESSANVILTQNTATPQTPASGEWGVVSQGGGGVCDGSDTVGFLYVNVGSVLTGKSFIVKRFPHGPFWYVDSVAHNNVDALSQAEGHGFSADDLSGPAYYINSYAYDNAGDGFKTLRGESIVWRGDISNSNDDSGFAITNCTNCEFTNNTANANGTRGFWDIGITSVNVDITNNLATNDVLRGFSMSAGTVAASGYSDADNNSYGNVNNGCSGVVNCATSDPSYLGGASPTSAAGFCLEPDSALLDAGTYIGAYIYGYGGESLPNPSPIGARGLCNTRRAAATRRAATRN